MNPNPDPNQDSLDKGPTIPSSRPSADGAGADLSQGATFRGYAPGQKVFNGRYTLKNQMGRGGMGVVWLAHDHDLDCDVALKFLPEAVMADESAVRELKREAKLSRELSHPHIIRVHDLVSDRLGAAISMEFVDGPTLNRVKAEAEGECLDVERIRTWVESVCDALEYAHNRMKVVHRDLKPTNIMLNSRGEVKVADFGIARSLNDSATRLTGQDGISGSLPYMSPQQLLGGKASAADDIYSLGATIYDLLTGKPPYHRGDIAHQIESERVVPDSMTARREELGTKGRPTPREWEETVVACLAKDPSKRPQTVREVMERLRAAPRSEPEVAKAALLPEIPNLPTPVVTGPRKGRTALGRVLRIAVIVVLAKFVIVDFYWKTRRGRTSPTTNATAKAGSGEADTSRQKEETARLEAEAGRLRVEREKAETVAKATRAEDARKKAEARAEQLAREKVAIEAAAERKRLAEEQRLASLKPSLGQRWTNTLGMKFAPVPGTKTLFCVWETRVQDFETFVDATRRQWKKPSFQQTSLHPAVNVSWDDAMAFCAWLTEKEQKAGNLSNSQSYRLPTDEEWSLAVGLKNERGSTPKDRSEGIKDVYPWGTEWPPPMGAGNYGPSLSVDSFEHTSPVGSHAANTLGLFDLGGNVWEWCEDFYDGSSGTRVLRGTSWAGRGSDGLLSSYRFDLAPDFRLDFYGFRCVLAVAKIEEMSQKKETTHQAVPRITPASPNPTLGQRWTNTLGQVFAPVPGTKVSFCIWETRVQDFQEFVSATGRSWRKPAFQQTPSHPAVYVSWDDAKAFCSWLTDKELKAGALGNRQSYRLPTDAEWSSAVGLENEESGGTPKDKAGKIKDVYPWGTQWPPPKGAGNYGSSLNVDSFENTSPVGSFAANNLGLLDVGGNVGEWCEDWYDSEQKYRLLRGHSWFSSYNPVYLLSSCRDGFSPDGRSGSLGFRCVLVVTGSRP